MTIEINFGPHTQARIIRIEADGSILCDLYGPGVTDTDILFPAGSPVLSLTDEQIALIRDVQ